MVLPDNTPLISRHLRRFFHNHRRYLKINLSLHIIQGHLRHGVRDAPLSGKETSAPNHVLRSSSHCHCEGVADAEHDGRVLTSVIVCSRSSLRRCYYQSLMKVMTDSSQPKVASTLLVGVKTDVLVTRLASPRLWARDW